MAETVLQEQPVSYLFSPANARLMAARSVAVRQANAIADKERKERLEQLSAIAIAQAAKAVERAALDPLEPLDEYVKARLSRVRGQLVKLDKLMDSELDPSKLDRLASAQARLAEQERQLAGRPLPGSLRPAKDSKRRPSAPTSSPAFTEPANEPKVDDPNEPNG